MAKFTFALPNGKFFELIGPADATVAQAEKIFLQQLAAGAIVGLADGNTLEAPAARLIKFTQSRLDRGTAGTADLPLLAINNQGILSALPPLSDTQVENGINVADFLDTQPAAPVGPLTPTQVQALAAQVAKNVDQPADVVTRAKGVGKYGLNLPQLEQLGLLKPGTSCRCTDLPPSALSVSIGAAAAASPNPANFLSILQSPSVWTGQDNVRGLPDILTNSGLQDRLQTRLIQNSYDTLTATGQIDVAAAAKSLPIGQVFTGGQASAALSSLGQVGTLALGLSGSGSLGAGSLSSLTQSVSSVFSSAGKGISSLISGAGGINFAAAGNLSFEGLGGSLSKAAGNLSNLASRGVAELGGLLSNASKFGPETAVEWAKGLAPADLTSQLNQLAKQGQFAINFSDFKIPNVVSGVAPAAAFKGTVNRATVDSAFVKLLGSNKIPVPDLSIPADIPLSFDSLEPAMKNATALLKNATNLAGQIPALAGGLATNLSNSSILEQAQGALAGGVVAVPGMPNTDAFGSMGSSLEQNLYGRAPDSDLVYTGRDDTVWDRINAERLRRGLPGLAAIGYPRPDDNMVIYT